MFVVMSGLTSYVIFITTFIDKRNSNIFTSIKNFFSHVLLFK